ncbi:acetylcholine receptor subunit alpha-like 1 isoform X2 [Toxorhynchites rutilus septentrionalis]|uniref:acetylcholine receptor subunit alpha-like 1 isoform X2 n=1 Tax=Toxorhynchites rutilus septentrionalis TaxID=329112 RepID=UPI002478D876|nr:acetylcholine receptor subunit alpha-like 1 isoform X2 [Toxorhynchites rutilus septentrionalis]
MGRGYCVILLFVCLKGLCSAGDTSSENGSAVLSQTWPEKLKHDLLENYDRTIRPAQHYNVTNVDVKFTIVHVDIDEEHSFFSVSGWIKMAWVDYKLKWNPANYGGLDVIRTNPGSVWKPDLVLYNNAKGSDNKHYGETNVLIYNNGKVLWVPPTDYHGFCELNLRMWPFDHQTCFIKIGSWTYDGFKLNITAEGDPETNILIANNQWSIRKLTTDRHVVYYSCCTEPYVDIQYNVTLQRHSATYKAIVISPAFVIILLALSVFWIPPQCGEKIVLNGVILLVVIIFLIYFAQQLPAMSGNTPLIVIFFSTTLFLVAISTIISIIVLRLTRIKHSRPVPRALKSQLDGCVGSMLFVSNGGNFPSEEDKEAAGCTVGIDSKQYDWCRVAVLIDRLAFSVFVIVFVISIIYYSI